MKKILILTIMFSTIPAFATCSIETGAACSIAGNMQPPSQQRNFLNGSIGDKHSNIESRLQPAKDTTERKEIRNFGARNNDYSYNSNCQFGICNKSGTPKSFSNRNN